MPPSATARAAVPLPQWRVWLTRVGLLLQVGIAVAGALLSSRLWLLFAVAAGLNLAVQPAIHRRQLLGRDSGEPTG